MSRHRGTKPALTAWIVMACLAGAGVIVVGAIVWSYLT